MIRQEREAESGNGWLQGDVPRRRQLLGALISVGIAAALTATSLLSPFEDWTMDQRLSLRGERAPDPAVVAVAINQPSIDALHEQWPIHRRHYADLINRLSRAGAKVIAFTLDLDAETTPQDDSPMIEAMRHAGNVVLAASATTDTGETLVLGGPQAQRYARVRVGMSTVPGDYDKTLRHLEWSVQGLPTLPLEVVRRLGRQPDRGAFHDGRAWLDVRGRPCTPDLPSSCAIPTFGFIDALKMSASRARAAFGGKVVVIGVTASGADQPVAAWSPGRDLTSVPHLVALQVATALRNFPLRQASWLLSAIFLVAGGFLPMVLDGLGRRALGARRRAQNALNGWFGAFLTGASGAVGIVVLSGAAIWAFDRGTVIPVGAPLLAAFLASSANVVQRYVADTLSAQRLFAATDSVVPKEYLRDLLARLADPELDTTRTQEGTMIFIDVVGFTAFTTALMAQEGKTSTACARDVYRFGSKYQELVIDTVLKHDGVVVDLMGDGVLAAFGLVGHRDDHEEQALLAAHSACTDVVSSMREWLQQQGWGETEGAEHFDVRAGIDSGELAVGLSGNRSHFELSVIAAATIGAHRLQDQAKDLGVTLCASDRAYNDRVSAKTRRLIAAEMQPEPIELRGQEGRPTRMYTWKRDDARYGLETRVAARN